MEAIRLGIRGALDFSVQNKIVLALFALALLTRLPLMSISLDEVDAANFHNALIYGYNVPWLRPHPPGYPVYMFMGWIFEGIVGDPLLSLTLLSALLGCLTIIPFYLLIREIAGYKISVVGSLLFIFNPLVWSLSEAALSDAPSMFFGVLLAWLCYRSRRSDRAFLTGCVVASLAIGIRQPNVALLPLLAYPLVYRYLDGKVIRWKLLLLGAQLFVITSLAWFVPAVFISSGGLSEYLEAINKQWSTAVRVYDVTHVGSPWILNVPYRVERFFLGYFFIYPWAGTDAKTPFTILLLFPWLFGFGLFVTSFNYRDPKYTFIGLWLAGIIYSILAIHFLPRYVMPQFPAFVIACLLGYRFLGAELLMHPRRVEIVAMIGIGCMLVSFAIKHQPPVAAFEFSPPVISPVTGIFSTLGLLLFVVSWVMYNRLFERSKIPSATTQPWLPSARRYVVAVLVAVALLVTAYAYKGYSLASIAHHIPSPAQQLVDYVEGNFDTGQVTPCWDNQTHSFYEAVTPEAAPVGYWSIGELYAAYGTGKILLVSDRCPRFDEIKDTLGLVQVAEFSGDSPLWAKTPSTQSTLDLKDINDGASSGHPGQ